ncbi:MAG: hypothetical protein RLZZ450_6407, partial [Pseudomonadota bacterium]
MPAPPAGASQELPLRMRNETSPRMRQSSLSTHSSRAGERASTYGSCARERASTYGSCARERASRLPSRAATVFALTLALTLGLLSRGARAQSVSSGFALDRFEPSERGSEWFSQDSLDLRGHLRPAIGL